MHRTRIKICPLTREADVDAALAAGGDALGFVLWPGSARGVSLAPQHQIALPLGLQPLAPPAHWRPGAFQH